jgi:hypothetical protein
MDFQSEEGRSYLHTATGEVVYMADEEVRVAEEDASLADFPPWQQDALRIAKDMLETDDYLALPSRFDIHEYRIMERFCNSVDNNNIRDDLCRTIRGRGASRRFKDRVHTSGMAVAWYPYQDAALREMALAWCDEYGIPYTEPER